MDRRITELEAVLKLMQQYGASKVKLVNLEVEMDFEAEELSADATWSEPLLQKMAERSKTVYDSEALWPDGSKPEFTKPSED